MEKMLCKLFGCKHVEKTKKGRKIIHSKCIRCGKQDNTINIMGGLKNVKA